MRAIYNTFQKHRKFPHLYCIRPTVVSSISDCVLDRIAFSILISDLMGLQCVCKNLRMRNVRVEREQSVIRVSYCVSWS